MWLAYTLAILPIALCGGGVGIYVSASWLEDLLCRQSRCTTSLMAMGGLSFGSVSFVAADVARGSVPGLFIFASFTIAWIVLPLVMHRNGML